jgi:hypothetical protein
MSGNERLFKFNLLFCSLLFTVLCYSSSNVCIFDCIYCTLTLPPGVFDCIYCTLTLPHVYDCIYCTLTLPHVYDYILYFNTATCV